MTKSKSGVVTKDITHLATNTLPVVVIQSVFLVLPLGTYLLLLTTLNRYQTTDSSGQFFFMTTSRIVSIVRYRLSLITTYLSWILSYNEFLESHLAKTEIGQGRLKMKYIPLF